MSGWSRDISGAPRGRNITVMRTARGKEGVTRVPMKEFEPESVWLATKCGKVLKSHWIPETEKNEGRWAGFSTKEQPVAWQPFIVPVHPDQQQNSDAAISRPGKPRPETENRSAKEPSVSNGSGEMQDEITIHLPINSETAKSHPATLMGETAASRGAGAFESVCPALIDDVGGF